MDDVSFLSLLMAPDNTTITEQQHYENIISTPLDDIDHKCLYLPPLPPSEFFVNPFQPIPIPIPIPTTTITQLPDLLSLENKPLLPPPSNDDYSLDSILENYFKYSDHGKNKTQRRQQQQQQQRSKRQSKISEKVYCLGKLLPGGHRHRKSTADMLEEANKYIKFLQAQVNALRSMPTQSSSIFTDFSHLGTDFRAAGELANLNRQQLLQVVVNSPAAQMVMADNGCCLFSAEQVALFNRIDARQKLIQQLINNLPL